MEFVADNWLGAMGLVSGLLCVWLLIKENVYTFPIGLVYAVITVVVMLNTRLYADVLLNAYYVLMNAYGWYFWLRGGVTRRDNPTQQLEVGWVGANQWLGLAVCTVLGTILMGWYFANHTNADFAYADSFTTVASFIAMWMSARKYVESWVIWFVVDVISVVLYLLKAQADSNLYFYAILYAVYLWMAVVGYRAWRVTANHQSSVA